MGLLASIASNIGKAGGEYTEQLAKLSADKEAQEAKNQAEIEKEKRIEEAWSKHHDIQRGETLSDLEQARINKFSDYKAEKTFDASLENDPTSLNYKVKSAQIDASRASANSSNAQTSRYNTETGMLNNKKSMLDSYVSEQDPEKRKQILNDLTVLEGKDPYSIQESKIKLEQSQKISELTDKAADPSISQEEKQSLLDEIQLRTGKKDSAGSMKVISVGTGEIDINGKEVTHSYIAQQDKKGNINIVDPKSMLPANFVDKDAASKKATELVDLEMNAEKKFKPVGGMVYDNAEEKSAISAYENERNSRISKKTLELMGVNQPSSKNGMLNATPGVVAQGESVIKVDDPVTQKQIDTAMVVIKRHESGDKGSDAKNPASTAEGTYQLVDGTAKQYGAKVVNGDITGKEKDSVAPKYYADIYNKKAEGLISAQVAAGFGQEAIDKAVESAKKNGGINWWDYVESKAISNNMGSIKQRMKEVEQQLRADGTPVPMDISVFNQKYNVPAGIKKVERIDG